MEEEEYGDYEFGDFDHSVSLYSKYMCFFS